MKCKEKITMEKYFEVAQKMRISENFLLDIRQYEPGEVAIITSLAKNDFTYNFVKETKDVDVRMLLAIIKYLDAEKELIAAQMSL